MNWYEEDVKSAVLRRENCMYRPESIFYGSSTFTLWPNFFEDFKEYKPVNLAFGGSTMIACINFFDRIVAPMHDVSRFVLYAGDNDLGDGSSPTQVFNNFLILKNLVRNHFGDIPFYFISIKPSIRRFDIIDKIRQTNLLVKNEILSQNGNDFYIDIFPLMIDQKGYPQKKYFVADGLHLNDNGYTLWKKSILDNLVLSNQYMHLAPVQSNK